MNIQNQAHEAASKAALEVVRDLPSSTPKCQDKRIEIYNKTYNNIYTNIIDQYTKKPSSIPTLILVEHESTFGLKILVGTEWYGSFVNRTGNDADDLRKLLNKWLASNLVTETFDILIP